jgi:hypothetical protein
MTTQAVVCESIHAEWGNKRKFLHFEGHHGLTILCRNGAHQVHIVCNTCGHRSGPLPKELWPEILKCDEVKIKDNTRDDHYPDCTVEKCTELGMEYHHFAPVNTFGRNEADRWPISPLCKEHHRFWHSTMNGYRYNAKGIDRA